MELILQDYQSILDINTSSIYELINMNIPYTSLVLHESKKICSN